MGLLRVPTLLRGAERGKLRDGFERTASLVYSIANFRCSAPQSLHIADHFVEPRLGRIEQLLPVLRQEQEGECRADRCTGEHAGELGLWLFHSGLPKRRVCPESAESGAPQSRARAGCEQIRPTY